MVNKYCQNRKKDFKKKRMKDIKTFLKKENSKDKKRLEKDIQTLLKKKKKKSISIIRNVRRSYLGI